MPYRARTSIRIIISILGEKMIDDFRKNRDDTLYKPPQQSITSSLLWTILTLIPNTYTQLLERVVGTIFRPGGHHFVKFPYKPMLTGVLSGLLYFALIISAAALLCSRYLVGSSILCTIPIYRVHNTVCIGKKIILMSSDRPMKIIV